MKSKYVSALDFAAFKINVEERRRERDSMME
jgi:hypothetical protein